MITSIVGPFPRVSFAKSRAAAAGANTSLGNGPQGDAHGRDDAARADKPVRMP
jgi:hypothetical protein